MNQSEWNNAWDSMQKALILYIPYIFVSVVMSLCQFIEKHWGKEPFSLVKMTTGLINNLFFTLMLYFGTSWLTNGNKHAIMFVVIFGTFQGKEWADKAIKRILWDRYRSGYGGYGDMYDSAQQFPQADNTQGDDTANGNKNNDNGDKRLDPRE